MLLSDFHSQNHKSVIMQPTAVPTMARRQATAKYEKNVSLLARPSVASHIRHYYDRRSQEAHAHVLDILNKSPVSYRTNLQDLPPRKDEECSYQRQSRHKPVNIDMYSIVQRQCYQMQRYTLFLHSQNKISTLFHNLFFRQTSGMVLHKKRHGYDVRMAWLRCKNGMVMHKKHAVFCEGCFFEVSLQNI